MRDQNRATIKCLGCNWLMTWSEQRHQYGRLIRWGMSQEQAKQQMPRCSRCITERLRETGGRSVESVKSVI